jgi:hypothetical protein
MNAAPPARLALISFAEALEALEKADRFNATPGQHVVCSRRGEDMATEQVVIIHNGACSMPVAASTAAKIRKAFTTVF